MSLGTSAIGLPLSSIGEIERRSEDEGGGVGASAEAAGGGITEPPIMFTVRYTRTWRAFPVATA